MTSQIFKKEMDNSIIFNLLNKLCEKTNTYYTFNNSSYKKGTFFDDTIQLFLKEIKAYYHNSKQKYLEKKQTYNSFTTILRQICNYIKIEYKTKIKYDKSSYEIIYYIYHSNYHTNNKYDTYDTDNTDDTYDTHDTHDTDETYNTNN
jgi:hypothetical protein